MRRAPRVDATQGEIVDTFTEAGFSVVSLAGVGNGCPDLLVALPGVNLLVECKSDQQVPSKRTLNEKQVKFHEAWQGPICVVENRSQAEEVIHNLAHYDSEGASIH